MADHFIDVLKTTSKVNSVRETQFTVTGISEAAQAVVTAANNVVAGDRVTFTGVVGMTEINNVSGVVTGTPSATAFTVAINSTGFTSYDSGGLAWLVHGVTGAVRLAYDDAYSEADLIDAAQRAKEILIELLSGN